MIYRKLNFKFAGIFLGAIFIFLAFLPFAVSAATLSVVPLSSNVSVGNLITAKVVVDTQGKVINSAEAVVQYPTDLVDVVSINSSQSIFPMWVEQPAFSNIDGQVNFSGGVPTPGYTGSGGQIISVIFRAKKAGNVSLAFSSATVRANDGLGTDILSAQNGGSFNISSAEPEPATPEPKPAVPAPKPTVEAAANCNDLPALDITSSTNPPDTWVASKNSSLSWTVPNNAVAVQTSLSAKADAVPSVYYAPPISNKDLTKTPDGIWYFNLRYKAGGCWSDISRYKLQIDTVGPTALSAQAVEVDGGKKMGLELSAKDTLSGVDHYDITSDDATTITVFVKDLSGGQYALNKLSAGEHNLKVTAYDLAGNASKDVSLVVNIPAGVLPYIDKITDPAAFETFEIKGSIGDNGTEAKLYIQQEAGDLLTEDITADPSTNAFVWTGSLKIPGQYHAWIETTGADGVKTASPKVDFRVLPSLSIDLSGIFSQLLNIRTLEIVSFIVILILLLLLILYLLKKKKRSAIKKVQPKVDVENIKVFSLMENNIREYVKALERAKKKRKLSEEEGIILKGLKKEAVALDKFFDEQRHLAEKD